MILHGVDTARYHPPQSRDAEFQISGLPGKYAIGCFGRVRAQKGTDVFIEAVSRVLPQFPDFSAVVVGAVDDGTCLRPSLKARVAEAGIADRCASSASGRSMKCRSGIGGF